MKLLYRWSRPLVGPYVEAESHKARALLELDGIQTQGLLKNCKDYPEKNLIAIVETHFKLSRQMEKNEYI